MQVKHRSLQVTLFYRCFPIWDTLRPKLTWSHYRRLISVEDEKARLWYMNEAADSVLLFKVGSVNHHWGVIVHPNLITCKTK